MSATTITTPTIAKLLKILGALCFLLAAVHVGFGADMVLLGIGLTLLGMAL